MAGRNRISKLEILDLIYFLQAHPEGVSFSDLMEVFKKDFRSVQRWIDDVREYFPDALIMTRRGRFKYFSLVPVLKKSLLVDFSREDLEVLYRVYEQVTANGNSRDANRLRNCISRIRTYCTQLKLAGLAHDTEVFKDLARDSTQGLRSRPMMTSSPRLRRPSAATASWRPTTAAPATRAWSRACALSLSASSTMTREPTLLRASTILTGSQSLRDRRTLLTTTALTA